jgi:glycosyltransferase involved in cell wall biosynthesis
MVSKKPLRIFHVITTLSRGGAENQLLVLVKQQLKSGNSVRVLYLKDFPEHARDIQEMGAEVVLNFGNHHPVKQLLKMYKFFRDEKNEIDVIHSHLPRAQVLCAIAKGNIPMVATRHDAELFFPGKPPILSRFLASYANKRITYWIAISDAVKDSMLASKEHRKNSKIITVHYGYDPIFPDEFKVYKNKSSEIYTIGTVARLVNQKDYPTLLKAFKIYLTHFPESHLLIVGDGPLRVQLEKLAEELKIRSQITWTGKIVDVYEKMKIMDIFVLASKTEGFGMVLLEAMDLGLPIVASDNTAIPEVLGSNGGVLFKTGDYEDLAKKLTSIRVASQEMELAGKAKTRLKFFSPEKMMDNIEVIYRETLRMDNE